MSEEKECEHQFATKGEYPMMYYECEKCGYSYSLLGQVTGDMNYRDLRTGISEILIKWGLPTRQVAISEIIKACEKYFKEEK